MKKILRLIVVLMFCLILVGCSEEIVDLVNIGDKSKYVVRDDLIDFKLEDKSLNKTGATFVLVNNTKETYIYSLSYFLEHEKDGVWYDLKLVNEVAFNLPAFYLNASESNEIEIDWEFAYGKLSAGKYRVIKEVFLDLDKAIDESDYVYIGAEFIIK